EEAWIERAQALTSRELEAQVRVSFAGDPPPEGPIDEKEPARRRVCIEMEAGDAEVLRQVLTLLRAQCGAAPDEVDDGVAHAAMARATLARAAVQEETAPTGEPYRIVLVHCPQCRQTSGLEAEVSDTVVAEAACDAELVDL